MLTQVGTPDALEEGRKSTCVWPHLGNFGKSLAPSRAPKTLAAPLLPQHQRDCIPFLPQFSTIANMGFTDFVSDAGLTLLNNWVKTRSYIVG
jgi:hypothetical protein